MNRTIHTLILLLVTAGTTFSQKFKITIQVQEDDGAPITGVLVNIKNLSQSFTTNLKGQVIFSSSSIQYESFTVSINDFRYMSYEKEFPLQPNNQSGDSLLITIQLEAKEIQSFDIYSKPQVVYQSKKLNVYDFEFVKGHLLLLTYEKRPGHHMRLVLSDEKSEALSSYLVNDDAKKLEKDYEGNIHLVCDGGVFQVTVYEKQIYLLKEDRTAYENYLKPLVKREGEQIYFSNYAWHYPAFSYFAFNTSDSSYKTLRYVEDKFLLSLYRAEYKYVDTRTKLEAYRMQLKTGVDKEIWAAVWNGFPNSAYYKPLYAPMFVRNDSVLLFDHYANKIFYFDESNNLMDSVDIHYHLGKEGSSWKKQLLMDEVTKKIYNVFEAKGTYTLVELNSKGKAVVTTKLDYKYPEKIKVHNGYVYFNYRPFESQQNKYLYKQLLN